MTSERMPYEATTVAEAYCGVGRLPVCVVLHDVRSLYNVGAFLRTADAVALERVLLAGITGRPPHPQIAKTALGAEQHVRWEGCADTSVFLETCRRAGYEIAAVETTRHAVDLFDWRPSFPVCLLFGHEVDGVSPELLARCDQHVRLPMRGVKHSLNVATAGGVVLYELLRKYRELHRGLR